MKTLLILLLAALQIASVFLNIASLNKLTAYGNLSTYVASLEGLLVAASLYICIKYKGALYIPMLTAAVLLMATSVVFSIGSLQ